MISPLLFLDKVNLKLDSKSSAILSELSLEVLPGEFIIILGRNGSGKSSLLKIINGLSKPTSGCLYLQGKNLTSRPLNSRAKSIITLTQDLNFSTFSQLTVFENCLIALHRNKRISFLFSKKKEKRQISSYLSQYHPMLCDRLDMPVALLSGGERQTLAFIMNLWSHPLLLLLDEHTSALDPVMAEKLMQLTQDITTHKQITTLMTTHNLSDALRFGNRLIVMHQGSIIYDIRGVDKSLLSEEKLLNLYK